MNSRFPILRGHALLWVALLLGQAGPCAAMDERYLVESEPQRLALVIGNSRYPNGLGPIPSSATDATTVASRLKELGFAVQLALDVKSTAELEDDVLPQFRKLIRSGDLVVFYFSGHGFAYGPHNFLALTELKAGVSERDLLKFAVSVENLEAAFANRSPGMQLFLIDACRTLAGFVVADKRSDEMVVKGIDDPPRPKGSDTNFMAGYAARPGTISIGSMDPNSLSLFTRSLLEHEGVDDREFGQAYNDVMATVLTASNGDQAPGIADWSASDLYLKPSPRLRTEERELWLATLGSESYAKIRRFVYRYSISRHAGAARLWLEEHSPDESAGYTALSPLAIERAWAPDGAHYAIARAPQGMAFARTVDASILPAGTAMSDSELGLVRAGSAGTSASIDWGKALSRLRSHGQVVSTGNVVARSAPSNHATVMASIRSGTELNLVGLESDATGGLWAKAKASDATVPVYFPLHQEKASSPVDLGRPLKEIYLDPRSGPVTDLVQGMPLERSLDLLRSQGRTITWVSISTEVSNDPEVQAGRESRAVHAHYLLKQSGLDGRRITTVVSNVDAIGDAVRLRIFGY